MKKVVIAVILLLASEVYLLAQDSKKTQFTLTAGYAKGLNTFDFENFHGFHLGFNFNKPQAEGITWDSQFSFNYSSDYEDRLAVTPLGGGRLYFNGSENKYRFFFNLLAGPALYHFSGDDYIETRIDIGYAGGFHMTTQKWQCGVSVEAIELVVFKLGIHL